MSPLKRTIRDLLDDGFIQAREGKKHTIFYHPIKKITVPVKRHDFDDDDRAYILKEAKIKV